MYVSRFEYVEASANEIETLELEFRRKGGRQARRNDKLLTRQIDLIGPLRCVCFSALDLELVRGEPSLRRNWLDRVVQLDSGRFILSQACVVGNVVGRRVFIFGR